MELFSELVQSRVNGILRDGSVLRHFKNINNVTTLGINHICIQITNFGPSAFRVHLAPQNCGFESPFSWMSPSVLGLFFIPPVSGCVKKTKPQVNTCFVVEYHFRPIENC